MTLQEAVAFARGLHRARLLNEFYNMLWGNAARWEVGLWVHP